MEKHTHCFERIDYINSTDLCRLGERLAERLFRYNRLVQLSAPKSIINSENNLVNMAAEDLLAKTGFSVIAFDWVTRISILFQAVREFRKEQFSELAISYLDSTVLEVIARKLDDEEIAPYTAIFSGGMYKEKDALVRNKLFEAVETEDYKSAFLLLTAALMGVSIELKTAFVYC